MKGKIKITLMFIIGVFSILVGSKDVLAATLVQKPIDDIYYTRRGGGQEYSSAQYNTYTMDGKTVYCIEPGINIDTHSYSGAVGWINSPYSAAVNRRIQLYGYYGYDYPGHNTMRYRMAAQSLIWEEVGGQIVEFWTEQYGYGDFINLNYERNQILDLANKHYIKPSFSGSEKNAVIGEKTLFTDSSGVLSQYEVFSSENATSTINGNTLSIIPNAVGDMTITLRRTPYRTDPTTIFVGTDVNTQKMGLFGLDDPVYAAIKLNVVGGTLEINKKDIDTTIPQGDAKFEGAKYEIMDEARNHITYLVINEQGSAKTEKILAPNKRYILKEVEASEGYLVNPEEIPFMLSNDNLDIKLDVYEKVIEKEVGIYKVFASGATGFLKAEPNITFDISLKSTGEYYKSVTTNDKGFASISLPWGTWIWSQKNTTQYHEKVEDFEITIDDSLEPITKIIANAEITTKLKVIKVDSESNKIIVRDGIKFKIKNLDNNEYVCQNITYPKQTEICVFETFEGAFVTPYALGLGNYQIEELEDQTIDGYVWNKEPLKFSIAENSNFINNDEFGIMVEVKFSNKQVKGEVEINKIGEKLILEDNTFRYEEIKLDGVSYDLYANGDIYSQDGTKVFSDKDIVQSFKTIDGYYKLSDLYLGNYCLIETETVLGHIKDNNPHCFTLKYKDQYTDILSLSFNFKNYLPKATLIFNKSDLVTGESIPNTWIEIFSDNEETNESTLIFSGYTDNEGNIKIDNLFIGKGHIIERESAEGYQLTDEIVYFEIKENGEVVKASMTNNKIVIEVPNTSSKSYTYLIPISLLALGIILILISKLKKKDK